MRKLLYIIICASAAISMNAQTLTIIHFNDTHSNIDPLRAGDYKGMGGVIEQAAYIDSVRKADGKRNVLLLNAGDFSQGTSYFPELNGDIEIDVFNAAEYDAVAIGNHEFDNGLSELARRLKNLKAPALCANYDFTGTPLEGLTDPYTIVRKAGKKIGIIGLLPDISVVVAADLVRGLEFIDPAEVVNKYADYLKNRKKCDLVICLSHLGYVEDKQLASMTRNVDLIVGGHSHTLLHKIQHVNDLDGKDVKIVQDWHWGLKVGNMKVKWD